MKVWTTYSDGAYSVQDRPVPGQPPVDIPRWQWWLYLVFCRLDVMVYRWAMRLDNRALQAMDKA